VPAATEQSIKKAIELLGEKLTSLKGASMLRRVNKEDLRSCSICYLVMVRSHREEKLHAAAALLAQSPAPAQGSRQGSYEELDHL